MIHFEKILRHCGHYEWKMFICRKKNFAFLYDWESYNRCRKCEPDELKPKEVIVIFGIAFLVLFVLYHFGVIQ